MGLWSWPWQSGVGVGEDPEPGICIYIYIAIIIWFIWIYILDICVYIYVYVTHFGVNFIATSVWPKTQPWDHSPINWVCPWRSKSGSPSLKMPSLAFWEGDTPKSVVLLLLFSTSPPFFRILASTQSFFQPKEPCEEIIYPHWGGWILDVARSSSLVLEWVSKVNVENRGTTRTIRWYLGFINVAVNCDHWRWVFLGKKYMVDIWGLY